MLGAGIAQLVMGILIHSLTHTNCLHIHTYTVVCWGSYTHTYIQIVWVVLGAGIAELVVCWGLG